MDLTPTLRPKCNSLSDKVRTHVGTSRLGTVKCSQAVACQCSFKFFGLANADSTLESCVDQSNPPSTADRVAAPFQPTPRIIECFSTGVSQRFAAAIPPASRLVRVKMGFAESLSLVSKPTLLADCSLSACHTAKPL